MPHEKREGRHARQRHGDGKGQQPVAQPVGELAAQDGPGDIAQREHGQRNGGLDQGEVIGRLQEGGEIDRRQPVADPFGDAGAEQAQHRRQRRAQRRPHAARMWPAVPRPTAANRLRLAAKTRPPTQISQPRQPISEPTAAAMGTPITKVSDWPLITQPSARPRWLSGTRPETSAKTTPMKAPLQPPPTVAHTAIQKKEPASACASTERARRRGPHQKRPSADDIGQPATQAEVRPHDMDVSDTRLATSGMLTSRSGAMSSRKGARVVPLEVAANEPRQAAPIRAHGMVRWFIPAAVYRGRRRYVIVAARPVTCAGRPTWGTPVVTVPSLESENRPLQPAAFTTEFAMQKRTLLMLAGGLR